MRRVGALLAAPPLGGAGPPPTAGNHAAQEPLKVRVRLSHSKLLRSLSNQVRNEQWPAVADQHFHAAWGIPGWQSGLPAQGASYLYLVCCPGNTFT
jgi:hypothetical protein